MTAGMRVALFAVLALAACGGRSIGDAGAPDGSRPDAGTNDDGGADAGRDDAGMTDAGAGEPTFTVMTLNLHCLRLDGTTFATNAARMGEVARVAVEDGVDAIAVQEACADGSQDAFELLRAALEDATGDAWTGHRVYAHLAWEGTPDEAEEGVGLLARALDRPTELVHRDQSGLRRVAAAADVTTALGVVRLSSVHLDHLEATARRSQAREVAVVALSEADPSLRAIVAGDLNARPGSPAHAAFADMGFVNAGEAVAAGQIDHVFAHRAAGLRTVDAWLRFDDAATRVSDHPAVLVRLAAATPPAVTVTRVVAEHDPGPSRHLSMRGDAAPLSWDEGWPMHALAPGRWRFVCTELAGDFEYKTLVDDAVWQTGPNESAAAGDDVVVSPSF